MAGKAKEETEIAGEKEQIMLAYINANINNNLSNTSVIDSIKDELNKNKIETDLITGTNPTIIVTKQGKVYEITNGTIEYIGNNKTITTNEPILMARDSSKAFWKDDIRNDINEIEIKPYVVIPENIQEKDIMDVSKDGNGTVLAWIETIENNKQKLIIASNGKINLTNGRGLFEGFQDVIKIDITGLNPTKTNSFSYMFSSCINLEEIKLDGIDVSKIEDMSYMFNACKKLKSIDLNSWNAESLKIMQCMFASCESLENLKINSLNTSKVENMNTCFHNCKSLKKLDLKGLNVSSVKSFDQTFRDCTSLEELNLDGWVTSSATSFGIMFQNCRSLKSINLRTFDTKNVTSISGMFYLCSNLVELDLSSFDTSNVTNSLGWMFRGCGKLSKIYVGSNWNVSQTPLSSDTFYECRKLSGAISFDITKTDSSMANYTTGYLTYK